MLPDLEAVHSSRVHSEGLRPTGALATNIGHMLQTAFVLAVELFPSKSAIMCDLSWGGGRRTPFPSTPNHWQTLGPLPSPKPARLPSQVHRHTDAQIHMHRHTDTQTHRHTDAQTHRPGIRGLRDPAGCPDAGGLSSNVKGEGQSAVSPTSSTCPASPGTFTSLMPSSRTLAQVSGAWWPRAVEELRLHLCPPGLPPLCAERASFASA